MEGRGFHETPTVRALLAELRRGVEQGDFTARNERGRWLNLGSGDAGGLTRLSVHRGGRLWSGEAMPPSLDSSSTPYHCNSLTTEHGASSTKSSSVIFFLLKAALRWRDGDRSWVSISVWLMSSWLAVDPFSGEYSQI